MTAVGGRLTPKNPGEWFRALMDEYQYSQRPMAEKDELEDSNSVEPQAQGSRPLPLPRLDPERWCEEYGEILFGFAAARVRDRATAQDLVQETFLAAIKASKGFAGRSTERAWLFGILRNKLADYYRLQSREVSMADFESGWPEERGAFCESGPGKDGWVRVSAPK